MPYTFVDGLVSVVENSFSLGVEPNHLLYDVGLMFGAGAHIHIKSTILRSICNQAVSFIEDVLESIHR